jgi:hypothetical protein
MEHQFHFNKKFYLDKKTGYWISTSKKKIRAHVWVWKNNHGEIEKGFHIHHKDGNKSNNSIENLEKISAFEHLSLHATTPEKKEWSRNWCETIRPLTKEWHSSEEGLEWHRQHGIKTWEERKPFKINCLMCGKEIETKTYHQKYCHQNCKAKHARRLRKNKVN